MDYLFFQKRNDGLVDMVSDFGQKNERRGALPGFDYLEGHGADAQFLD